MTTQPKTHFLIFQWSILVTLLLYSLFVDRWGALLAFSLFIAWKLYSVSLLPTRLRRKLAIGRLKKQSLRESFNHSLFSVNKIKTQLLELKAPWPTVLLLDWRQPKILIHPRLADNLDDDERSLLAQWCYLHHEAGLGISGFKIYSIMAPWFRIARFLDRWVLWRRRFPLGGCEKLLHHLNRVLFYPILKSHREVLCQLEESFTEEKLRHLRQKLFYLLHCHGEVPPLELSFMLIEPDIVQQPKGEVSFGHIAPTQSFKKGPHYG